MGEQSGEGSGGERRRTLEPPRLRKRRLESRHEERAIRWLKWLATLVAVAVVVVVALNWWIVQAYLIGPRVAVAQVCEDSPFARGSVLAAGGADAVDAPDHPALDVYRGDPEGRSASALRIRDRAALLGDDDLASAAAAVSVAGPFDAVGEIERVEAGCRRHVDAVDATDATDGGDASGRRASAEG